MRKFFGLTALLILLSANAAQAHEQCYGSGCNNQSNGIRRGDTVYVTSGDRDGSKAFVVGIQPNGKFALRFEYDGRIGTSWDIHSVAKAKGCASTGLCVGQKVIATAGNRDGATATIVGVSIDGTYAIRFNYDGRVGTGWDINSLACAD